MLRVTHEDRAPELRESDGHRSQRWGERLEGGPRCLVQNPQRGGARQRAGPGRLGRGRGASLRQPARAARLSAVRAGRHPRDPRPLNATAGEGSPRASLARSSTRRQTAAERPSALGLASKPTTAPRSAFTRRLATCPTARASPAATSPSIPARLCAWTMTWCCGWPRASRGPRSLARERSGVRAALRSACVNRGF